VTRRLLVGADVGGTAVKFVLVDDEGRRLARGDVPTDPHSAPASIGRLADAVRVHVPEDGRIIAAGLASAGIVDTVTGDLGRSPNLPGWEGANLLDALRDAFGPVPAAVANDVNGALYGEFRYGAGRGCRHLVMMALGTGVGGGVMVDGHLVTGYAHGAGEIGHMTLDPAGPICQCGNPGCLEAYCGSVGLLRRARELAAEGDATDAWRAAVADLGPGLTTRHCHDLAVAGDATALRLFAEAGARLGQATASLVNVLAPERVIIGGGVAQAGDLFLAPCRELVARHVMSEAGRTTPVVPAELGTFAASMGAAALAAEAGAAP
jgi:glucokinase